MTDVTDAATAPQPGASRDAAEPGDAFAGSLVDWRRTGLRMRRSGIVLGAAALLGAAAQVVAGRTLAPAVGTAVFLALAAAFVVEVVVVGGSALRGMLRAGEQGERLAGRDVALLPPQARRRA